MATMTSSRHVPRGPGCRRLNRCVARLDGDDGAGPVGKALELDAIADDREVGRLPLALHPAAHPGLDQVAVIGDHGVEPGKRAKHEAAERRQPLVPNIEELMTERSLSKGDD